MSRVRLLLGGVQKAGTSTLHDLMRQLVGLASPASLKEVHFFDDEAVDWASPDYSVLHRAFAGRDPEAVWFESTPITLYWPPALERVRAYNPDMKLVFIFRDPVARAYSQWAAQWAWGLEDLPFSEAIAAEDERVAAEPGGLALRQKSYRRRGLYGEQLERALRLFDREQMLLLRFDDLVATPRAVLKRVARFTGAALPDQPKLRLHRNRQPAVDLPSPLGEADVAFLAERFADDMARFAALSQLDISGWLAAGAPPDTAPAMPEAAGPQAPA